MHVLTSTRIDEELFTKLKNYCKEMDVYFHNINTYNAAEVNKQLKKEVNEKETIIIVGNDHQVPTAEFIFRDSRRPTDSIYEMESNGDFVYRVGRIYGKFSVLKQHLDMKYKNNNKAVVIDCDPKKSDLSYKAVEELGFDVTPIKKLNWRNKKAFKKASFILQYSDGPYDRRVHGTPRDWRTGGEKILDFNDVRKVKQFDAYPFVFSEACETCLFGPLLSAFLETGSVIVGSTSETINNEREEPHVCSHTCDGFKYLLLDYLHEEKTIGDAILRVKQTLFNTLDSYEKENLLQIKYKGIVFPNQDLLPILQFNTFGNPDRPTPVVSGKFDLRENIPVDI